MLSPILQHPQQGRGCFSSSPQDRCGHGGIILLRATALSWQPHLCARSSTALLNAAGKGPQWHPPILPPRCARRPGAFWVCSLTSLALLRIHVSWNVHIWTNGLFLLKKAKVILLPALLTLFANTSSKQLLTTQISSQLSPKKICDCCTAGYFSAPNSLK